MSDVTPKASHTLEKRLFDRPDGHVPIETFGVLASWKVAYDVRLDAGTRGVEDGAIRARIQDVLAA